MGQKLCCLRPPSTSENQSSDASLRNLRETNSLWDDKSAKVGRMSTLEHCLMNSPGLNPSFNIKGGDIQVLRQPSKRVYPSSPDYNNNNTFYTPRMSFSSVLKLEKIDEFGEKDEEKVSMSRSGSGKLKKKVTFKLPEEADIIHVFYSPTETFIE